jgi:hypothetical protein
MGGLRNARSIGCWEQDHESNGSSNGGGKTGEACAMRPEARRGDSHCERQRFSTVSRGGRRGAEKRLSCRAQELADGVAREKSG